MYVKSARSAALPVLPSQAARQRGVPVSSAARYVNLAGTTSGARCYILSPVLRLFHRIRLLVLLATPLAAQWVNYPSDGVPRKADGKVNMTAPAPRLPDGKPDFSGVWVTAEPNRRSESEGLSSPQQKPGPRQQIDYDTPGDQTAISASRQMANIGIDLPGGLPYQPWLIPIVKERTANLAIDDPHIRCLPDNFLRAYGLPHLLKFVHKPGLLVVLNELNAGYRQVFTDGRPLPENPQPTWQGYSSAKWSGDTLVIDTIGLRDDTWIDWNGSVLTESAKVREQMRRPDFGHLEIRSPSTIQRPTRSPGRSR